MLLRDLPLPHNNDWRGRPKGREELRMGSQQDVAQVCHPAQMVLGVPPRLPALLGPWREGICLQLPCQEPPAPPVLQGEALST